MKLISFRVTVVTDSAALVVDVRNRLRSIVDAAGIEPIGTAEDAETVRVFWPTVEVVQGGERPDRAPQVRRSRKPTLATG
jgi:hypothetical protein